MSMRAKSKEIRRKKITRRSLKPWRFSYMISRILVSSPGEKVEKLSLE